MCKGKVVITSLWKTEHLRHPHVKGDHNGLCLKTSPSLVGDTRSTSFYFLFH